MAPPGVDLMELMHASSASRPVLKVQQALLPSRILSSRARVALLSSIAARRSLTQARIPSSKTTTVHSQGPPCSNSSRCSRSRNNQKVLQTVSSTMSVNRTWKSAFLYYQGDLYFSLWLIVLIFNTTFFLVDNGAAAANTAAPSFEPRGRTMQPAAREENKARDSSDEREVDLNQLQTRA